MALIETVELADARRPSGDPTNTSALRRTWRSVSELRLRQLRAQVRLAILEHDMLGLGGGLAMYTPAHARLKGFQEWLTQSTNGVLGGGWPTPYVVAAWQSGHAAAMRETGKQATLDHYAAEHLAQLAQAEFVGIAGALVQQVIRASVQAVTRKLRPHRAYSMIVRPFDKMAVHRVRTNVNVVTVTAPTGGVKSGDGIVVGALFGICATDAAEAAEVEIAIVGVFELPKASGQINEGAAVWWNATNGEVSNVTGSGFYPIGVAVRAAGSSAATVRVRLSGVPTVAAGA
jgi:predicted RecA/RadA family phage recombinase